MPDNPNRQSNDAVEAAITHVLTAEAGARDTVARARSEAAEIAEQTREKVRRLALHIDLRIRAVRAAFEARVTAEVGALEGEAAMLSAIHDLTPGEVDRVEQAVAALASVLTGGSS